jgi:RNA methyltransferase, TrmH family
VLAAAIEHRAPIERVFVSTDAPQTVHALAAQADAPVSVLGPGVAARVGSTQTPQGVFAVVTRDDAGRAAFERADFVVVAARVNDPGNAGTLWRSAAAAGAGVIVLGTGSVDAYNPKLVRATAGACFAMPVIEDVDVVETLDRVGRRGLLRIGTAASAPETLDGLDLTRPCVIVLGHEAQGLPADLPLDVTVSIPMTMGAESLNLAMAGTVACFEVARQRRSAALR